MIELGFAISPQPAGSKLRAQFRGSRGLTTTELYQLVGARHSLAQITDCWNYRTFFNHNFECGEPHEKAE